MGLNPVTMMAGASIVSGLMGADAASSAADAQVGAANRATDAQTGMYNQTVQNESPFRLAGVGATNKLNTLLGIGSGGGGSSGGSGETEAQIRARLTPQFTGTTYTGPMGFGNVVRAIQGGNTSFNEPSVDQNGLDAAVQAELAKQGQGGSGGSSDPSYGSLLKPFGMSDFQLDPGIQFQMQQGNLALQNSQAAKDGVLSGGALKDLLTFNQGLAGTGYKSAFDRYMANKGFTFNSLADVANRGQAAASNSATGGSTYAQGIAGTMTGAGNAAAAGSIGTANALSGGISGAGNAYFLRNLLQNGGSSGGVVPPNPYAGGAGVISDSFNVPVA